MNIVITPPTLTHHDLKSINRLFRSGLRWLHLRLPQGSESDYICALNGIAPEYRSRVILCGQRHLARMYGVGGLYFSYRELNEGHLPISPYQGSSYSIIAVGAHSLEELRSLRFVPSYALLSPLYDSISKEGYKANQALMSIGHELQQLPYPVLAMGGITPTVRTTCLRNGYAGIATIGAVWQSGTPIEEAWSHFLEPEIISIAGHDPTGGAGIIADHHTAAYWGVRCHTIVASLTLQSTHSFREVQEVSLPFVLRNIELQLQESAGSIRIAKIGLTTSLSSLIEIIHCLKRCGIRHIIWDCITLSTADSYQVLHREEGYLKLLGEVLSFIDLVTPNGVEAEYWFGTQDAAQLHDIAQQYGCSILLKSTGGSTSVVDKLIRPHSGKELTYEVARAGSDKHGTGCMLSSSIAALLAQGMPLERACYEAQHYISRIMQSRCDRLAPLCLHNTKRIRISTQHHLQYITHSSDPQGILARATQALQGGVRWIQLRLKEATTPERIAIGISLRSLCHSYGALLIIDDDVEAALHCNADGVHLGIHDTPPLEARKSLGDHKIIGFTCHNSNEVMIAHQSGADYIGVGPYRFTSTKQLLTPLLGLEGISELARLNAAQPHPLPMVAIGGITLDDLPTLASSGVSGIAISHDIDSADNITEHCHLLDRKSVV